MSRPAVPLADERVIEVLTAVKGVGRWTAEMYLMFRLGRACGAASSGPAEKLILATTAAVDWTSAITRPAALETTP